MTHRNHDARAGAKPPTHFEPVNGIPGPPVPDASEHVAPEAVGEESPPLKDEPSSEPRDGATEASEGVFCDEGSLLTVGQAVYTDWPKPEFILGALQYGDLGLIVGADGAGKSMVAMTAAVGLACGRTACGIIGVPEGAPKRRVLYIAGEDRVADHGNRMTAIAGEVRHDGIFVEPGHDYLKIDPKKGERFPFFSYGETGAAGPTFLGEDFFARHAHFDAVIIDPMRMAHDLNESDGPAMDAFARWLVNRAIEHQMVIVVVHHASQGALIDSRNDHHTGRGATDFPAACRAVYTLRGMTENEAAALLDPQNKPVDRMDYRVLINSKASHAAEDKEVYLNRRMNGVLRAEPLKAKAKDGSSGTGHDQNPGREIKRGQRGRAHD